MQAIYMKHTACHTSEATSTVVNSEFAPHHHHRTLQSAPPVGALVCCGRQVGWQHLGCPPRSRRPRIHSSPAVARSYCCSRRNGRFGRRAHVESHPESCRSQLRRPVSGSLAFSGHPSPVSRNKHQEGQRAMPPVPDRQSPSGRSPSTPPNRPNPNSLWRGTSHAYLRTPSVLLRKAV